MLIELFYKFLKNEKGYYDTDFNSEKLSYTIDDLEINFNLVLIKVKKDEYVIVVEYHDEMTENIKLIIKNQVNAYLKESVLKEFSIYLIYPKNINDFEILILKDIVWVPLFKKDFPNSENLSSQIKYEIEFKQNFKQKEFDSKKKINILFKTISVLSSIVITILITNVFKEKEKQMINSEAQITYKQSIVDINKLIQLKIRYKDSFNQKRNEIIELEEKISNQNKNSPTKYTLIQNKTQIFFALFIGLLVYKVIYIIEYMFFKKVKNKILNHVV